MITGCNVVTRDAEQVGNWVVMDRGQLRRRRLAVGRGIPRRNGSVAPRPSGGSKFFAWEIEAGCLTASTDQGRLIRFGHSRREAFRQGPGENEESLHAAFSDVWLEHWTENTTRPDAQGVSFWEVIHLGLIREVGVTRPQFPDRMPRMKTHKIARLPPLRREDTAPPIVASKPLTLLCLMTER